MNRYDFGSSPFVLGEISFHHILFTCLFGINGTLDGIKGVMVQEKFLDGMDIVIILPHKTHVLTMKCVSKRVRLMILQFGSSRLKYSE